MNNIQSSTTLSNLLSLMEKPTHIGSKGNKIADKVSKETLDMLKNTHNQTTFYKRQEG